jgi:hypothetical protein
MNKNKFAYYILLFVSAVELGRGVQLIFNPLFWDPLYSNVRLTSGVQIIISLLLFIVGRLLKPQVKDRSI